MLVATAAAIRQDSVVSLSTMDATDRLHVAGLRATPQRLMVLELLTEPGRHLTAEEIWRLAAERYPGFNRSTAFRILQQLSALGLVKQTRLGQSAHYEIAHAHGEHHHLICSKCGRIEDISADLVHQWSDGLAQRHGFAIDKVEMTMRGRCRACA